MADTTEGVPGESEFVFELCVCQWVERNWPPAGTLADDRAVVVARQLGTERRRWDTVVVECDRAALAERAAFGERELDSDLLHVVRHAPAEWAWYRDALPDPGYPWRYVRAAVHRASDRGLVERQRRENRVQLRRKRPYPDWIERVVAVENKPDLDASAARDLAPQVERDVALGLADEVWVATAATGDRVEPVLLEDLPPEVGILTVEPGGEAAVAWHPRSLPVDEPGTRILDRPDGRGNASGTSGRSTATGDGGHDASAARFEYVDPDWKRAKRREVAERAYGRGWRSYADAMRPDCRHYRLRATESGVLPYCAAKEYHQSTGECSGSCPDFEPEPPAWRTGGWPIEGGPGAGIKRLLARQRRRQRPGLDERDG